MIGYGVSSVVAFVTGLMPFAILLAAAVFAGGSLVALILWVLTGAWAFCSVVPILFLGSQKSFAPGLAIAGSSMVVLLCGYALIMLSTHHQVSDPLYFSSPIAMWAWAMFPFLSNSVQFVLASRRYQELRRR
jgi:hypothetical protein